MSANSTLRDLLSGETNQHQNKVAIVTTCDANGADLGLPSEFTYAQLGTLIGMFKAFLYQPRDPSKTVWSLLMPNSMAMITAFLAVTTSGFTVAPLNPVYGKQEVEFYWGDSQVSGLILPLGWLPDAVPASLDPANQKRIGDILQLAEKMNIQVLGMDIVRGQLVVQRYGGHRRVNYEFNHPLTSLHPRVTDETRALILHTSGTTSRPKCVPLSHGNLMKTVRNIIYTYQLTDKDRSLIVMPLFHVHGLLASLLATLGSSGSVVITSGKFSKSSCWRDLAKYECTWYSAVPTIHHLLSDGFCPLPKLRFIRSCSAPLAPSLFQLMEKKTGVPVLEAYAMTEASHQMCSNPLPPLPRRAGTVGIPHGTFVALYTDQIGVHHRHLTEGEVITRGSNVMSGYVIPSGLPDPNLDAFVHDSTTGRWFKTGDWGYFTEEGYLVLKARVKEIINRGGEKIAPAEVEWVLLKHPDVSEAVSLGMPDKVYGEQVAALVVLKNKHQTSEQDILEFCRRNMAPFKVPSLLRIVESIPKTATGKVQRRHLAQWLAARMEKPKANL